MTNLLAPPDHAVWWDARALINKYNPERGVYPVSTRIKARLAFDAITRLSVALGVPPEHIEVCLAENQMDNVLPDFPDRPLKGEVERLPPLTPEDYGSVRHLNPPEKKKPARKARKKVVKKGNKKSR